MHSCYPVPAPTVFGSPIVLDLTGIRSRFSCWGIRVWGSAWDIIDLAIMHKSSSTRATNLRMGLCRSAMPMVSCPCTGLISMSRRYLRWVIYDRRICRTSIPKYQTSKLDHRRIFPTFVIDPFINAQFFQSSRMFFIYFPNLPRGIRHGKLLYY